MGSVFSSGLAVVHCFTTLLVSKAQSTCQHLSVLIGGCGAALH